MVDTGQQLQRRVQLDQGGHQSVDEGQLVAGARPASVIPSRAAWQRLSMPARSNTAACMVARFLDGGHRAAWVAGDEVYGGNPKLRTTLEERGIGYVLAVACTHEVTTGVARFRADALARKIPTRAWQKLSAGTGARGHRFYDWAAIDLADPHAGSRQLLIRRNRGTGELAYYRCYSPTSVPLTELVNTGYWIRVAGGGILSGRNGFGCPG